MNLSAKPVAIQEIAQWRDLYRHEMNCQVIHDSIHSREGWAKAFLLLRDGAPAGFGLIAVAGPWKGKPTAYEFFLAPQHRDRAFDFFEVFRAEAKFVAIEVQSNEPLLSLMLLAFCKEVISESILFHDRFTTKLPAPKGAIFRKARSDDSKRLLKGESELDVESEWIVLVKGKVVAKGGILFHYNRPYGDIYMSVVEKFRRKGLGSYLVQELKRVAYENGNIPAARCNPTNVPSRRTLQKAGFVPCGNILVGQLPLKGGILPKLEPSASK